DELHGAVMADLEPLRQHPDRGRPVVLETLDLQQHQILLRLDPGRPRHLLAPAQEAWDLVTQLGQRAVVDGGRRRTAPSAGHDGDDYIAGRYNPRGIFAIDRSERVKRRKRTSERS